MKKILFLILTAVAVSFFIALGAVNNAMAADAIKIGAVLPMNDITGKDASRSMQLAVKQINAAGGLLGRQVELVLADDESNPDKAAAAVEKLVNIDKVDVIVGGVDNATTMGVIPALKKYNKVTVWTGASSAKVEQALEGQDWFFHLHLWDYQLGAYYEKIWRNIVQKYPLVKKKIIFIAYKEDPFGSDMYTITVPVAQAYLNLLRGEAYKSAADFPVLLRNARIFGPDIYIWEGSEQDAIPMLEEAKNRGFTPPVYLGKTLSWPVGFGKQVGAEGVMFYSYWHDSMNNRNKKSRDYSDAFNNEFKEAPATYFGPLAYSSIMIVADAIKNAGSLDQGALISALADTKYESPLGDTFTFVRSFNIKHQAGAYPKLMQWQGGEVKVIYPWELATARLAYPFPAQGFNREAPLEEKAPVAPPAKPAAPKAPAVKPKPAASAPAAKPAVAKVIAPKPKPAVETPAPAATPEPKAPAATTPPVAVPEPKPPVTTSATTAMPEAKPAVAAVNMTGRWDFTVITPQGPGTPIFTLKQDGNKLAGSYYGAFGEALVTGFVKGNNFELEIKMGGRSIIYKGKVEGNEVSGNVDFAGQEKGFFTGKKK